MKIIVGLGNPGGKYRYTRHNIGFMVVEKIVKNLLPITRSEKSWVKEDKFLAEICRVNQDLLFVKPQTYMNKSGLSVVRLVSFYKIDPSDLWVIHDDIDLPLGKIRIRVGGGSAGHNGVDSIIKSLGKAEFIRFRLGIGRGKLNIQHSADFNLHRREIEKYVLSPFKDTEGGEVKKLIRKSVKALELAVEKDIKTAMNRYN